MKSEEKSKIVKRAMEAVKAMLPTTYRDENRNMPIMQGDTITFKLEDGQTTDNLLVNNPASTTNNGDTVNAWVGVRTANNNQQMSFTQLFARPTNGLALEGDTPSERYGNFAALLEERRELSITVNKVRVQPSTYEGRSGTRICIFNAIR